MSSSKLPGFRDSAKYGGMTPQVRDWQRGFLQPIGSTSLQNDPVIQFQLQVRHIHARHITAVTIPLLLPLGPHPTA